MNICESRLFPKRVLINVFQDEASGVYDSFVFWNEICSRQVIIKDLIQFHCNIFSHSLKLFFSNLTGALLMYVDCLHDYVRYRYITESIAICNS